MLIQVAQRKTRRANFGLLKICDTVLNNKNWLDFRRRLRESIKEAQNTPSNNGIQQLTVVQVNVCHYNGKHLPRSILLDASAFGVLGICVVVVVVVFTLKTVPISTQYFLTSVLVQLTRTNAFRGHRLTTQKGYTLWKKSKGNERTQKSQHTRHNWKRKEKKTRKIRLQTVRRRRRHVRQRR